MNNTTCSPYNSDTFIAIVALVSSITNLNIEISFEYCKIHQQIVLDKNNRELSVDKIARKVINCMNINNNSFSPSTFTIESEQYDIKRLSHLKKLYYEQVKLPRLEEKTLKGLSFGGLNEK